MVIKGNGAVNTMEAVKINTKKRKNKGYVSQKCFSSVLTGITWGAAYSCTCYSGFPGWIHSDPRCEKPDTGAVCMDL